MATRSIAFRLNDKNREDREIMEWLDQVVYEGEYYDSLTEAVKWAILCFVRGEIRFREEMSIMELMQEFVRDFAKQSKADNEQIMQDAISRWMMGHWLLCLPCLGMMRKIRKWQATSFVKQTVKQNRKNR